MKNQRTKFSSQYITERTMFFKMQNFPVCGFLEILTSENEKKCQQKFTKKHHVHACIHVNHMDQITLKVRIWYRYIQQVSLQTICPPKAFQLHYSSDNNAKCMVKHFIFLQKFSVIISSFSFVCWPLLLSC